MGIYTRALNKTKNLMYKSDLNKTKVKKMKWSIYDHPNIHSVSEGDYIITPRFLAVRIDEKFANKNEMYSAGYTEPTHYDDDSLIIAGKPIDINIMIFACCPNPKCPIHYKIEDMTDGESFGTFNSAKDFFDEGGYEMYVDSRENPRDWMDDNGKIPKLEVFAVDIFGNKTAVSPEDIAMFK